MKKSLAAASIFVLLLLSFSSTAANLSNYDQSSFVNSQTPAVVPPWFYTSPSIQTLKLTTNCGSDCVNSVFSTGLNNFTYPQVGIGSVPQYSAIPLTYGLVGYWPLDERSGTSAYDLSGNGKTGTLANSPIWLSGSNCKFGGCLNFTNSNYVNTGNIVTSSTSVSVWIYAYSLGSANHIVGNYGANYKGISIYFNSGIPTCRGGNATLSISYDAQSNSIAVKSGFNLLVCTYDSSTKRMQMYTNGIAGSPISTAGLTSSITAFYMGKSIWIPGGNFTLDNAAIWNRALSASEIQELYNSTFPVLESQISTSGVTYNANYYRQINETLGTNTNYTSLGQKLSTGSVAGEYWVDQSFFSQPLDILTVAVMLVSVLVFIIAELVTKFWALGIFAFLLGAWFLEYMYGFTSVATSTVLVQSSGAFVYQTTSIEPFLMANFCLMLVAVIAALRIKRMI